MQSTVHFTQPNTWMQSQMLALSLLSLQAQPGCTSVDIGASAKLELVHKFCYLGDMLSVDGDAAAEARIRIGWNKFRQLVPLLTNKDV